MPCGSPSVSNAGTGSATEHLCPEGTYSASVGASVCDVLDCAAGRVCPAGSATNQGNAACTEGFYCPAGTGPSDLVGTALYCDAGRVGRPGHVRHLAVRGTVIQAPLTTVCMDNH